MTLLRVTGASVTFATPRGSLCAVDAVGLSLGAGETLALVGESGCGKSTLARGIIGLEPLQAGKVEFRGERLHYGRDRRRISRLMQLVFQDPDASLNPRMTLRQTLVEPLRIHRLLPQRDELGRVRELLEQVGIDPVLEHRFPHELSGGQKQRVCIARALAVRPELVILDEAVSALDVSVQAQILNLLGDLKDKLGLAYLFITHDLGVVRQFADKVTVMYLGQVVEHAATEDLFARPQHPYTEALMAAVPSVDKRRFYRRRLLTGEVPSPFKPPLGCRFHTRCPEAFERCRTEPPPLFSLERSQARCWLREPSA